MFRFTSEKKANRVKKNILKGVYEDNLRILGKHTALSDPEKIPFFIKKMFLFFSVGLLTLLNHGNYINVTVFPESEMTASIVAPKTSAQSAAAKYQGNDPAIKPSDYNAFITKHSMPLSKVFGLGVRTIMIDPGHGGLDSGTAGKMKTKEKDITLDIAKRLRERLKKYGEYTVIMTREHDITLPLNKRVDLARVSKADLFISIHLNYLPSKPINIIETYYFGPSSDAKTLKLAEEENAGSEYGLSDFKEIIEKIGDTMKLQESRDFAVSIQKNLFLNSRKHNSDIHNFGVKRAPFVVLLGVDVPAVLAEVSCLSNINEEIELHMESHRENIARYLEAGILDYLNKGETRYEAKRQ